MIWAWKLWVRLGRDAAIFHRMQNKTLHFKIAHARYACLCFDQSLQCITVCKCVDPMLWYRLYTAVSALYIYILFWTEGALRVSLYQAFGQWEKVHRIQGNGAKSIAGSIKQKDLETGKRRSLLAFFRSLFFALSCPGQVDSIFRLHSFIGCLPGLLTDPLLFVWFRLSFPGTFGIHVTLLDLSPPIIHQR